MSMTKGFWQHKNGKIYAIKSTSFGEILGGAGPLEPNDLKDLDKYDYKPAIVQWLKRAIAEHQLHRINPSKQLSCPYEKLPKHEKNNDN